MAQFYKHLGKALTPAQVAALLFALSEGEVGPGSDAMATSKRIRVRQPTVRFLVGAGLLKYKHDGPLDDGWEAGWATLTGYGRAIALIVFEQDRGFPYADRAGHGYIGAVKVEFQVVTWTHRDGITHTSDYLQTREEAEALQAVILAANKSLDVAIRVYNDGALVGSDEPLCGVRVTS